MKTQTLPIEIGESIVIQCAHQGMQVAVWKATENFIRIGVNGRNGYKDLLHVDLKNSRVARVSRRRGPGHPWQLLTPDTDE